MSSCPFFSNWKAGPPDTLCFLGQKNVVPILNLIKLDEAYLIEYISNILESSGRD